MKKIFKIWMTGLAGFLGLALVACSSTPEIIDEVELDRCLSPLNFSASVANGKEVTFKWDVVRGADQFVLELYNDAAMSSLYSETTVFAEDVPYLATLDSDKSYYARVKAQSSKGRPGDSKWTVLEKKIATFEVKNALYPQVADRDVTSVTLKWNKDADDASDISHISYAKAEPEAEAVDVLVTAEAIAAGQMQIAELEASTQYIFTLYFKSADRGEVTAWTMPDTSGATEVSSTEELLNALSGNAVKVVGLTTIVVKYNDGVPYDLGAFVTLGKPVSIIGEPGAGDKRPAVVGNFQLNAGATYFHAEGLAFSQREGAGVDDQTLMRLGEKETIESISFVNCEIYGYSKGIFYDNSKESDILEQKYTSLLIHDIGDGQDVFDMRKGAYGSFTLENSSFFNGGRTILRADASTAFSGDVTLKNNFFYKASASSNSNNAGVLYVRGELAGSFSLVNNLFVEMTEGSTKSGLVANDGNAKLPSSVSNNHFFNCTMAAWFNKLSQADATSGGGSVLLADPCVKSAASNFVLKNDVLIGKYVGDPRWWANSGPLIPEVLTAVEAPYVWNFSDKAYYAQGDVAQSVVMGNLYFDVSNDSTPMSITKDNYIHFDKATQIAGSGTPSDHFLKFIVKGPGSVVMQPLRNDNGNGTEVLTVIVGGKALGAAAAGTLAQNKLKVVLRDLVAGAEAEVYLASTGTLDLAYLEWSDDVSYDPITIELEEPVIKLSMKAVPNGTEKALDISWEAVDYAKTYEVTFGSNAPVELPAATLKYTLSAADVAALAVGEHAIKVQAKADPNDPRYLDSKIASDLFTVEFVGDGSPVSMAYPDQGNFTFINSSDKGSSWEFTKNADPNKVLDPAVPTTGSFYTPAVKAGKVIERIEITAPASMTKKVILYAKYDSKKGYTGKCSGEVALNSQTPIEVIPDGEFDRLYVAASTGGAVKVTNVTVYYKDESVDPDAPQSFDWNFSAPAFSSLITTLAGNPSDIDQTVEGLHLLGGGGSIKSGVSSGSSYIQMGGAGSNAKRVFSFKTSVSGRLTVVASNTGSSEDLARKVAVEIEGETPVEKTGGTPSSTPVTLDYDLTVSAEKTVYIYCTGNGLRFYNIAFTASVD